MKTPLLAITFAASLAIATIPARAGGWELIITPQVSDFPATGFVRALMGTHYYSTKDECITAMTRAADNLPNNYLAWCMYALTGDGNFQ